MRPIQFVALALALAPTLACSAEDDTPRRQVVLVSLDTLRADHMSAYGYEVPTTPNLEAIAKEDAVLFERAFSQASWTLPSQTSMFTSMYPNVHQVISPAARLSPDVMTLPKILNAAGLETAAFTDGGFLSREYGFSEGFQDYWDADEETFDPSLRGLDGKFERIEDWLSDHRDRDFFLFLHTYEIHAPYESDEPFYSRHVQEGAPESGQDAAIEYLADLTECQYFKLERFSSLDQVVGAYDGGIAWVDDTVGRLVAKMKRLGIWDDALVVFTSDHGESLMDRDVYAGHGAFLHDGEVHIPLIVKYPGGQYAGRRVDDIVESIDIMPTILSAMRIPTPPDILVQGHDLTAILAGEPDPTPYAFSSYASVHKTAIRSKDWTYLGPSQEDNLQRFVREHLRPVTKDPEAILERLIRVGEFGATTGSRTLALDEDAADQEALQTLRAALKEWTGAQKLLRKMVEEPESSGDLSPEVMEQLRRLGYL